MTIQKRGGVTSPLGVLFLLLGVVICGVVSLQPERCSAQSRQIVVNPDAEAFIGVILPVRSPGPGLLGCGLPTQDGVELLEALRWATGVLNSGTESLVPGVRLGLKIWDTCGHSSVIADALSELVPVLREGPALCTLSQNSSASLLVGIVDGAGASKDPVIRQALTHFNVPLLVLEPETLVPAEDRAKAVISLALELQWRQVALVYGSDDYGTRMYRSAVRLAADSDLCVISAERLEVEGTLRGATSILESVRGSAMTAAATPKGSNVTGVLVLSRRSHYLPLLEALRHSDMSGLQWLFSDLLSTEELNVDSDQFFSLTLAPPSIPPFEQYWANQVAQSGRGLDNNLVQEYEMMRRGCRLPGWAGPNISDLPSCSDGPKRDSPDSLKAALRGRNAAAALHVVHTLAYALKAAWRDTCSGQGAGVCPSLRMVSRQEFSSKYLSPLEFDHSSPEGRVTGVPRGGKVRAGDPSEMAASSLALLSYRTADSQKLHKVFEYHLDGVEVSDRSFRNSVNRVDVTCSDPDSEGLCPRCLKLREARNLNSPPPQTGSTRLPAHFTIPSPQHVYIAGVFSVHQPPSPGTPMLGECGALEPSSARQVEAFTWALKRVNERLLSPLNMKLGAILLDACHSPARALTLPAVLMGEGSEPVLAAVNTLTGEEAKLTTSVFTALNVTTLTTAALRSQQERYSMQVGPASSALWGALDGVLQHLGWDYVSVVTSRDVEVEVKAACVAHQEVIDPTDLKLEALLTRLMKARESGARGVVLWTTPEDTRRLFTAVSRAKSQGTIKGEDLFWMVVNSQGELTQILEEFGDVLGGAIVFSPEQKPVREFIQYLRRLREDEILKTADNPWLEAYYHQVLQSCSGPDCERSQLNLLEEGSPEDARTVQAVWALGAAIARTRIELCPKLPPGIPGICPPGGGRPDMREALNAYLHYTPSERAGGGEDFTFTSLGAGDVAIEISNMRRGGSRSKSRGLQAGINFEKVGLYRGEMQSLASLLGYRDSGEEVQLASLTSRCTQKCSKCRATDRFVVTHPDSTFYVGVTLSMRSPAPALPLECGPDASARGVQQLEALLWALDRANANSSTKVSAVVLNSCKSQARTSRDVAQLLDHKSQHADKLIAMISADGPAVASRVTNLAVPQGLPVITNDSPYFKPYAPFPLQLNAGLELRTRALISIAQRLEWASLGAVYSEDGACSEAMLKSVQSEARKSGITIPSTVALVDERPGQDDESARSVVRSLVEAAREQGLRTVMLLLTRPNIERVLRASSELHQQGELVPGEIVWLGVGDQDLFQTYSNVTLGSLVLESEVGWVPEFESHFRSLNLSHARSRDPWFPDFWSNVFKCRGAACASGLYKDLSTFNVKQDPEIVNIINSVMTVSQALDSVRRKLCPDEEVDCSSMSDIAQVRSRLFEVMPHMAFVGSGMSGVAFSVAGGDNLGAGLKILNVRRTGSDVFGLVPVGSHVAGKLKLQQDTAKAYGSEREEMALGDVVSECRDCDNNNDLHQHMEVSPGRPVTILGLASVHSSLSLSECGSNISSASFQRAAALSYAVEKANLAANFSGLSAVLLDDCSEASRAVYQTFEFLAKPGDQFISAPNTVAVTLMLDNVANQGINSLLTTQGIPVVTTQHEESVLRARLHAALGVAQELSWSKLTLVRSTNSGWSKMASELLKTEILPTLKTTCLGSELLIDLDSDTMQKELISEINSPLLLVLETRREVEQVLNILSEVRFRSRVLVVSGGDVTLNSSTEAEIYTVTEEENPEIVAGFREYVASSVTGKMGNFPSDWSSQFLASGSKWKQESGVSDIVQIVKWVAQEVSRLCYQDQETPLCGQDPKSFRAEIQATLEAKMSARAPNLTIWRLNSTKSYEKVGSWSKSSGLNVNVKKWKRNDTPSECESFRVGRSGKLTLVVDELPIPPVSLLGELRVMWGLVCAALSVFGALVTVALVVYFVSATQKAAGTSVLGYQILFGVLILYGSNFAFLMSPSEISCLIRRLLPGLAYAVILSGMLVKVVTTWRGQGCVKGSLPDGDPLSRPTGLVCCALALVVVQAFLAGGWLILVPAQVEPPTSLDGAWTCAAASGRELLSSLSFLAALLLTTAVVALKARKDGEARSILACCIFLGVAGGAWVAAANSPTLAEHHRDCVAGVIAGLVSATLVLLCIFVPKLLQHARLSRQQERHQQTTLQNHSKLQPVMYGVPHYPSSLVIKAFPEPDELLGVERMMGSRSSRTSEGSCEDCSEPELAAIRDDDITTPDITLQIPSPLYAMDMFTGTTSTFGHGAPPPTSSSFVSSPPPPPPPPMPRFNLVDHRVPGSNEFKAPSPGGSSSDGGTNTLEHEGISYI